MPVRQIKLGTYNINNFFDRFDNPYNYGDDHWGPRTTKPKNLEDIFNLAERLRQDKPDILALQEVENKGALHEFNVAHLGGHFEDLVVVEANDPRGIQVALASCLPLGQVVSYQFLRDIADRRRGKIFSRDFLEADILDPDTYQTILTIFVAHLKSKYIDPALKGDERLQAEQKAAYRRTRQAMAMAQIIRRRFPNPQQAYYVVMGDFNDTPNSDALTPILHDASLGLYDVLQEFPSDKRWTHYWSDGKEYSQLDYILLSPPMRQRMIAGSVEIVQRGNTTGSDHRPIYVKVWAGWD